MQVHVSSAVDAACPQAVGQVPVGTHVGASDDVHAVWQHRGKHRFSIRVADASTEVRPSILQVRPSQQAGNM